MAEKKIKIVQEEGNEVPVEIIAKHIISISEGIKKLLNGPLNEKALLLLIQNAAPSTSYGKIGITEIRSVIEGISSLEKTYIRKKQGAKYA
jgi:hypothetical protein